MARSGFTNGIRLDKRNLVVLEMDINHIRPTRKDGGVKESCDITMNNKQCYFRVPDLAVLGLEYLVMDNEYQRQETLEKTQMMTVARAIPKKGIHLPEMSRLVYNNFGYDELCTN
ncbi:hypothetical protein QVD17_32407 [Tagetes erecta]|uniref:Uncharacterized protein n=1 Tax=Tagetes erecta TaxID=13708 RepID=A0AAD8K7Z2_TARER|nr:hypothetical protein QVD17_32407 [Tagetes erecta]